MERVRSDRVIKQTEVSSCFQLLLKVSLSFDSSINENKFDSSCKKCKLNSEGLDQSPVDCPYITSFASFEEIQPEFFVP